MLTLSEFLFFILFSNIFFYSIVTMRTVIKHKIARSRPKMFGLKTQQQISISWIMLPSILFQLSVAFIPTFDVNLYPHKQQFHWYIVRDFRESDKDK